MSFEWLLTLCLLCFWGHDVGKAQAPPLTNVLIQCDATCNVAVDDQPEKQVEENHPIIFKVGAGDHILVLKYPPTSQTWTYNFQTVPGQGQIVKQFSFNKSKEEMRKQENNRSLLASIVGSWESYENFDDTDPNDNDCLIKGESRRALVLHPKADDPSHLSGKLTAITDRRFVHNPNGDDHCTDTFSDSGRRTAHSTHDYEISDVAFISDEDGMRFVMRYVNCSGDCRDEELQTSVNGNFFLEQGHLKRHLDGESAVISFDKKP